MKAELFPSLSVSGICSIRCAVPFVLFFPKFVKAFYLISNDLFHLVDFKAGMWNRKLVNQAEGTKVLQQDKYVLIALFKT